MRSANRWWDILCSEFSLHHPRPAFRISELGLREKVDSKLFPHD
jgi:hypothetical protein